MAKKFNLKNKSLWKKIGIGAVAGVLGLGAVMGVGALLEKQEEVTTKNIHLSYEVGGLTEDGKYLETKESIYTKDAFECQGLDVDLAFNNNVSYRVYFYDNDNNFLSSTDTLTENYDETTTPKYASYARIVVTPNDDDKISWYEVNGYAKQLEIEVNKEQNPYVFYSSILDKSATYTKVKTLGRGRYNPSSGFSSSTTSSWYFTEFDTQDNSEMIIKLKTGTPTNKVTDSGSTLPAMLYYDLDNAKQLDAGLTYTALFEEDGYTYYSFNVSNVGNIAFSLDYHTENLDIWTR